MNSITMTDDETAIYDGGDDTEIHPLMADLRARAQEIIDEEGCSSVEIYTSDGIVVAVVTA